MTWDEFMILLSLAPALLIVAVGVGIYIQNFKD